jgi:hypothetical protein
MVKPGCHCFGETNLPAVSFPAGGSPGNFELASGTEEREDKGVHGLGVTTGVYIGPGMEIRARHLLRMCGTPKP